MLSNTYIVNQSTETTLENELAEVIDKIGLEVLDYIPLCVTQLYRIDRQTDKPSNTTDGITVVSDAITKGTRYTERKGEPGEEVTVSQEEELNIVQVGAEVRTRLRKASLSLHVIAAPVAGVPLGISLFFFSISNTVNKRSFKIISDVDFYIGDELCLRACLLRV